MKKWLLHHRLAVNEEGGMEGEEYLEIRRGGAIFPLWPAAAPLTPAPPPPPPSPPPPGIFSRERGGGFERVRIIWSPHRTLNTIPIIMPVYSDNVALASILRLGNGIYSIMYNVNV
jgi:hypothetical protein